ncbi:DUF4279 domain-containing protein [Alcanivorax sp. 1008]|uniref:DUF4279 domain-containing protein n=1 Tax=Alcanivorax sp. 1008 TaxID=2816853 RepID=UPI001DB5CB18|nr:DUF4279 domain-containing protein [Alcanivorax sp. 1008]MCC1497102.1 DUF4279 domain-containing protein [Alcanivorax sp. 1008]
MTEHHVYFAVFGYQDEPLAITLLAGREPDEIWRKGESYSAVLPEATRTENRWIISSGLDHYASHSDHFEKLILKLERLGPTLQQLQQRYRCGVGVSQYYFMDDPAFYLPDQLISRFRQLGIHVAFNQLALDNSGDDTLPDNHLE